MRKACVISLFTWLVAGWMSTASAQDAAVERRVLRVGHWIEARGTLEGDRRFRVQEIEVLQPGDDHVLVGEAKGHSSPARFYVLGQEIHTSARTDWSGMAPGDPKGKRVKVTGRYRGPRKFSASDVKLRGSGRDRIEGRIDNIERVPGALHLEVMNFILVVPAECIIRSAVPLPEIPLAQASTFATGRTSRDEDDEIRGTIRIAPNLTFGGQVQLLRTDENDYDLDSNNPRDRADSSLNFRGELMWEPSESFYALAGIRHNRRIRDDEGDGRSWDDSTLISEAYGYWRHAFGTKFDVQVGRQDFDDGREWLYDQNLDGVRLIRTWPKARLELSRSTSLSNASPRDEETINWIAYLSNNNEDQHAAAYFIHRDRNAYEATTISGLRAHGEWFEDHSLWLELAHANGWSSGRRLNAYALDMGNTWSPDWLGPFDLTFGYAWGSGDSNLADGTDGNFQQTGFQDNNAKFGGITSFRYYGELLRPELSNMGILTLGIGARLADRTSLDLVWHKYDQVDAMDRLRRSDIGPRPDGIHRDIGWEADLILGMREFKGWHLEVVGAVFDPGSAFPGMDRAHLAKIQLRHSF